MNTKLIVYFFLVAVVAVVYSRNRMQQFLPFVKKFCTKRFGPDSEKFLLCYQEKVKKLPEKYNSKETYKACFGEIPTESDYKVKCDLVKSGPSAQRKTFVECLMDKLNSTIQGTGLTLEQAISIGAMHVNHCSKAG